MTAIFKKEFKSYFHNMIGPVFMAAVMVFIGLYFFVYNMNYGYPYFAIVLSGVSIVFLLLVPVLTMRSFAEEKHSKTDQLLLTSPLSVTQIVLGKFFAMTAVLGICMIITCAAPVIIKLYGGGALLADYIAIIAFFLLGSAYMSIGMFISSLTESQVIAAVVTFCVLLVLQLVEGIGSIVSSSAMLSLIMMIVVVILIALLVYYMTKNVFIADGVGLVCVIALIVAYIIKKSIFEGLTGDLLQSVSLVSRFDSIINQTLDLSTIIYYISVSVLFVFLTVQSVQKRRWS